MQLLYTGATLQGTVQLNPDLSLGGHVSSSSIPNDTLSNVFSTASSLSIQNKRRETKMIALQNNDGLDASGLIFTFALDSDSICNYKVAFVTPTIQGGVSCFEKIINSGAAPYYASYSPVVNGTVLNVPALLNNAYLGIWLVREYNFSSDGLKKKTCANWLDELNASVPSPSERENFSFSLDYTV